MFICESIGATKASRHSACRSQVSAEWWTSGRGLLPSKVLCRVWPKSLYRKADTALRFSRQEERRGQPHPRPQSSRPNRQLRTVPFGAGENGFCFSRLLGFSATVRLSKVGIGA